MGIWTGSQDADRASDLAYLQRFWAELAAEAWRHYTERGRGMVVIDGRTGSTPIIAYLNSLLIDSWHLAEFASYVCEYNPHKEVVFAVVHREQIVRLYVLAGLECPPPEAYAKVWHIHRPQAA
jgi:hypothetical protein